MLAAVGRAVYVLGDCMILLFAAIGFLIGGFYGAAVGVIIGVILYGLFN